MAHFDPMELASPFNSAPCTPKPKSRNLTAPSPAYKSNATAISLDSSPERNYKYYGIEDQMYDYLSRQEHHYNNGNDSDATQIPDFTEYANSYQSPARRSRVNITPLKLSRPRTYARHRSEHEDAIPQILGHMVTSPSAPNPPIKVLLMLTPQPASLAETTAFEDLGSRFCKDFRKGDWSCINLYAHFRRWGAAQKQPNSRDTLGGYGANEGNVGIGAIHPYALRAKLEQEREVQWRLAIPVLQALIDEGVKKGSRAFVVCGMSVGDVEGVRAFGRTIVDPAGILAFMPSTPLSTQAVPLEYSSKTVSVDPAPPSQTYEAFLTALYAKQLLSDEVSKPTSTAGEWSGDRDGKVQDESLMDWI